MKLSDTNRMQIKQVVFLLVVIISLLIFLGFLLSREAEAGEQKTEGSTEVSSLPDRRECDELRELAERRYLRKKENTTITRREGEFKLDSFETVEGDLVIIEGKAMLVGRDTGTVLVICGNAELLETAEVDGDVVCIGGRIDRASGSRIRGDQVEASPRSLRSRRRSSGWERERDWHYYGKRYAPDFQAKIHYNRVDGFFLGVGMPRQYNSKAGVGVFGFGGYGFSPKRWQYQIGGELYFGRDWRFALGSEAHDFTDSEDAWIIPEEENSLAAGLINEDFRDYFRREGFSAYASQNFSAYVKFTAGYRRDHFGTLPNETDWALFGSKKEFRLNPAADEGLMAGYFAELSLDRRDHDKHPRRGWLLNIATEFNRPDLDSDFDFDRVIIDLRRYQPVGEGKNFDLRLRAASGRGVLPAQYLFDLGGISTLPGYRFKEFTGDRMVLGNVEYRLDAGRSRLRDVPLIGDLNLLFFADAGFAWFAEDHSKLTASFDYLTWDKFKTDVGLGLTDNDGRVRVNFAKRTDRSKAEVVVTFRLNRSF